MLAVGHEIEVSRTPRRADDARAVENFHRLPDGKTRLRRDSDHRKSANTGIEKLLPIPGPDRMVIGPTRDLEL